MRKVFGFSDMVLQPETYSTKEDAEAAARNVRATGYLVDIVQTGYAGKKIVQRSTTKSKLKAKENEYKAMGYKTEVYTHKRGWLQPDEYHLKVQAPIYQIRKQKLTDPELKAKEKAEEEETAQELAKSPWGWLIKLLKSFLPTESQIPPMPKFPEFELPSFQDEGRYGRYGHPRSPMRNSGLIGDADDEYDDIELIGDARRHGYPHRNVANRKRRSRQRRTHRIPKRGTGMLSDDEYRHGDGLI